MAFAYLYWQNMFTDERSRVSVYSHLPTYVSLVYMSQMQSKDPQIPYLLWCFISAITNLLHFLETI